MPRRVHRQLSKRRTSVMLDGGEESIRIKRLSLPRVHLSNLEVGDDKRRAPVVGGGAITDCH